MINIKNKLIKNKFLIISKQSVIYLIKLLHINTYY